MGCFRDYWVWLLKKLDHLNGMEGITKQLFRGKKKKKGFEDHIKLVTFTPGSGTFLITSTSFE